MKTVIVDKDGSLSVREVPKPKYGPKQALTKTIANGVCGTDIHLIKKAFKGITEDMYPLMLGHENVGEVVEVGAEVKGLRSEIRYCSDLQMRIRRISGRMARPGVLLASIVL